MEIWLNPACSKCRTAVAELDALDRVVAAEG
jgi:arsenate reductase-like glutaredoxin family protein